MGGRRKEEEKDGERRCSVQKKEKRGRKKEERKEKVRGCCAKRESRE
jgi:hypothetical protein